MKSTVLFAALAATLSAAPALAQGMACADYTKADKQIQAQMAGASTSTGDAKMDAEAAALDKKVRDYCVKNPKADLAKAMEEAMK
jgi:hypothetical protein